MLTVVADQQVLRGTAAVVSWQKLDQDGEAVDPGTVTVGITRADGTTLVAAGTATVADGTARTFALTAAQIASLDVLTATWTAGGVPYTTLVEVVGGYYFTIAALRARETSLGDTQKYPTADLQALRRDVETEFEEITELAFVPRYDRQRLDGTGGSCLLLPRPHPRRVLAVAELAADGTTSATWTAGQVAAVRLDADGELYSPQRMFPRGAHNVVVAWEHGYDRPPTDVRDKAMLRLRGFATRPKSSVPDRSSTFQIDGGTIYRLDQADRKKTGINDIDAVLGRYSMAIPGLA